MEKDQDHSNIDAFVEKSVSLPNHRKNENLENLLLEWMCVCGGAKTRKAYGLEMRQFLKFAREKFHTQRIADLVGPVSSAYAATLKDATEKRVMAANTAARKLCSVSSFFAFCASKDVVTKNPFDYVKRPSLPRESSREALTLEEVQKLLAVLDSEILKAKESGRVSKINEAQFQNLVVRTLLDTGMRIAELLQLQF